MLKQIIKIYDYRTEYLNSAGQLHRTDGPAVEWANGDKHWYQNGKRHRTDGPAIEYADGDESWYQNGELHRTDGPAIEHANGTVEYWLEGKEVTKEDVMKTDTCNGKVVKIDGKKYRLAEI